MTDKEKSDISSIRDKLGILSYQIKNNTALGICTKLDDIIQDLTSIIGDTYLIEDR